MSRRFISISLPESITEHIAMLDASLPGSRWEAPEKLHVTLRFIGDMPQGDRALREALGELRAEPFDMSIVGVGTFPGPRGARVLWAGVEAPTELHDLQSRVEHLVRGLGFPPEKRRFRPHVTLARLHRAPGQAQALADFVIDHNLLRSPPFRVAHFDLMSSILHPSGSRYHAIERFELRLG